LSHDIVVEL